MSGPSARKMSCWMFLQSGGGGNVGVQVGSDVPASVCGNVLPTTGSKPGISHVVTMYFVHGGGGGTQSPTWTSLRSSMAKSLPE